MKIIFSPLLAFLNGYFILSCPEAENANISASVLGPAPEKGQIYKG